MLSGRMVKLYAYYELFVLILSIEFNFGDKIQNLFSVNFNIREFKFSLQKWIQPMMISDCLSSILEYGRDRKSLSFSIQKLLSIFIFLLLAGFINYDWHWIKKK